MMVVVGHHDLPVLGISSSFYLPADGNHGTGEQAYVVGTLSEGETYFPYKFLLVTFL